MRRVFVVIAAAGIAAMAVGYPRAASPQQAPPSAARTNAAPRALLDQYCVSCHNQRLKTAGLMLDTQDVTKVAEGAAVWEKVVRQLRSEAMPPAGRPRPDHAAYTALASHLESELDRAAAAEPNPGRLPAFQRLTRTEYHHAVRDLLALEDLPNGMDITLLLPADSASSGFDNLRDLLFVSSTQLEQYLSAARKISRLAMGDPAIPPLFDTYTVPEELPQNAHIAGTPFGARGGTVIRTTLPVDGEYAIEVVLAAAVPGHQFEVAVDGERVKLFTIPEPVEQDAKFTTESSLEATGSRKFEKDQASARRKALGRGFVANVPLKAGPREIVVSFLKRTSARGEDTVRPALRLGGGLPGVDSVIVKGPFKVSGPGDTASRRRLLVCKPSGPGDEARCAKQILSALARRAYRRPVSDVDVQPLLPFYESGRAEGGFETGIQWALERVLVSPQFLFRIETDPASAPGRVHRVGDLELASRLSFFLWSSIPDDELLEVAAQNQLHEPAVLDRQVRRMFADPRSRALVTNFAEQWLFLRDLETKSPNGRLFRDFDKGLQQAFEQEADLFVDSILRSDRSVVDLLNANHTFVNERLARHYGIPGVYGSDFRRVALGEDSPRRGLLGKGSILTLSSYAARTSPVLRGKYILDNLLNSPPPPPPPNIPPLVEKATDGKPLAMRDAMAKHRANAACASCHARMDPLGFAMENFDAVGQWRTETETGDRLDVSAALPDGTKVDGVIGLRDYLVSHPERFVTSVTEKLFAYAVGRKTAYYDAPTVRKIVRDAARGDYRFSSLVMGIVNSVPFQMRSAASAERATAQQ